MLKINQLPEDALLYILTLVPATDLIRYRHVCTVWRNLIDSPTLWKTKCLRMGYISKDCKKSPHDWKIFYHIWNLKRNLLQNPHAEDSFNSWTIEQNGGNLWKVEDLPGDCGEPFPDHQIKKYFVTSYEECKKSQLIQLKRMGYQDKLIDIVQPDIVIEDWYAPRWDCGSTYEIVVQLLSKHKKILKEFRPNVVRMESQSDAQWKQMKYIFHNYGPGVRYIYFQHGGHDTQFWAGWYGVRVTNSSVTIEPENLN
ncbi:F-box protein 6 S homeolog [Xenopus laevis]|uniref:F-box protein 6 S homeolog n=2 Tax=Xenopus laevis TaxID=8355 RepID=Q5U4U9_XENLA|nr:F-box protein 6 S homeolog [Xenopus laevis]AAH84945.1 LOC495428 protein [Xenopus laevis]OCT70383.1 hypothetical protein XELAEV_18037301mg [Xenopus laevis]